MPITTSRGTRIPSSGDPFDLTGQLTAYDRSLVPQVRCASGLAEAKARTDFVAEGGTGPMYFLRTDERVTKVCWAAEDETEPIEFFGGRQHGATAVMHASVPDNTVTAMSVLDFHRLGPNIGLDADGKSIIIPQTGYYLISTNAWLRTAQDQLGRAFIEYHSPNLGTDWGREPATNENRVGASYPKALRQGDRVQVRVFHATGGRIDVTAETDVVQLTGAGPNW